MGLSPIFTFVGILLMYHPTILANEIDLFSSTTDIENLFKDEDRLQIMMQEQLISVGKQIKMLDWFLDTFYGEGYENYTEADAEEYVSNPINTYCLLKRTALHWPRVKAVIFNDTVDNQMEDIIESLNKSSQPSTVNEAFSGLFSMQQMYNLDIKELATGKIRIPGRTEEIIEDDYELYAKDLQALGKIAFERGFYDRAHEFYTAAEWKANKDGGNQTEEIPNIKEMLNLVISTHDSTLIQKGHRGPDWSTYLTPFDEKLRQDTKFKDVKSNSYVYKPKLFVPLGNKEDLRDQFNMLCRGETVRSPKHDKNLMCFRLHYGNPFRRFVPFKVEEVNLKPYVAIFRDFFNENEVERFVSTRQVNKTKTMEEIEKESEFRPELDMDPILDIIKEAEEKLNLIKAAPTKKDGGKGKKAKTSKVKGSKKTKGQKGKEQDKTLDPGAVSESDPEPKKSQLKAKTPKKGKSDEKELSGLEESDSSDEKSSTKKKMKKKSKVKKIKTRKSKKRRKTMNKISLRISDALRLNNNNTYSDDKLLQVQNFGIGGSYSSNMGFNVNDTHSTDGGHTSAMATFVVFLTNVAAGGATIFPNLGITIWPKQGDAVFWNNMDKTGDLDPLMAYGSCPILHGMKLGLNKPISTTQNAIHIPRYAAH